MAREFAKIVNSIWIDDDWRALTVPAQHLYLVLLTDPKLSYAGVTDWQPKRITQKAAQWSQFEFYKAAAELSEAYFVVVDEDTEEVLVRSFLKNDEIMKHPKLSVSMAKAYADIASNKVRQALVHELQALASRYPDWVGWTKPQVKEVLRQRATDPKEMRTDLNVPDEVLPDSLVGMFS